MMKTFKTYLEERNLLGVGLASLGIVGAAMAAPPKPEAISRMVQYVKEKEGFRPVAERDKIATGKPVVVGYGTTHNYPDTGKPIKVGETITPEKAEEHIKTYFKNMTPHLEKIPDWDKMDAGKQAALLSFGYNFGPGFYKPDAKPNEQFYSISQDLKNKNWENVPNSLKLYIMSGGKVQGGLVKRRNLEGQMWRGEESKKPQTTQPTAKPQIEQPTNVHQVVSGDTIAAIAKKYGKPVDNIIKTNPELKVNPNLIKPGQKIKIN